MFAILDFGSQYTWLIARRLRELGYFCKVFPYDHQFSKEDVWAFIISGGPASVLDSNSPRRSVKELQKRAPVLAICYGMQMVALENKARLVKAKKSSYGPSTLRWTNDQVSKLKQQKVWMSHGDSIESLPKQASILAKTEKGLIAGFSMEKLWAFQFHPEVSHTEEGKEILKKFIKTFCPQARKNWKISEVKNELIREIKKQVPSGKVFCALSGGVDSTVAALLIEKALGSARLQCIFVDTGLLREGECEAVLNMYKKLQLNVRAVKAEDLFLSRLKDLSDPEQKRKVIGKTFIDIFKKEMKGAKYLAQGTLYTDVIESLSPLGLGVTIKSHHNVGGLPSKLNLKLVEPLKFLFKDEVRFLGKEMGMSKDILYRHPFPGPGLAIRIPGAVSLPDVKILRQVDAIFIDELHKHQLYKKIWQAFAVLLPVKAVGVQGDNRTYSKAVSLRAVTSEDGMTSDFFHFSSDFIHTVSHRITNEVAEVNRVLYDVTTKPPGTIEWE